MPFVSDKQRKYLYAVKPAVAAKFAAHEHAAKHPRYGRKRKLRRRKQA